MTCVIAIDPGKSGAAAFLFPDQDGRGRAAVFDLPYAGKELNAIALAELIEQYAPALAVVEKQGPRPLDGKPGVFKAGTNYGRILAVLACARLPIEEVTPAKWKAAMRLSDDKEQSRARALAMFPAIADRFARKMDEGRAEACLLARYGADTFMARVAA